MTIGGRTTALLVAVSLAATVPAIAATAQSVSQGREAELDRQMRNLSGQIAEASRAEAALLRQIDAANTKKREAEAQLAGLDRQIPTVTAELAAASRRLGIADGELAAAEVRLAAADRQLAAGRDALKQRAIDAYIGRPQATALLAWSARVTTLRELAVRDVYIDAMLSTHARIVRHYDDLQHEAAQLKDSVARQRAAVAAERDLVAGKKATLDASHRSAEQLRAQLARETERIDRLLREVRSRRTEFQAEYNKLRAESESIARMLRSRQSGQGPAPSGKGTLASPIPGARVTSGFGPRRHPIFGDTRMHNGIDYGSGSGTPIRAAADGVVLSAGEQGGYGLATLIDHGNSLATLYAHQSRFAVGSGAQVTRGQIIGYVGSTGFSTGPHLHFEVRVDGTPVDPMRYL